MSSKELKIEAKSKLANGKYLNLLVINIFYALIMSAFLILSQSFADASSSGIATIASIVSIIISIPLSYGVLVSTIKILHDEEVNSTEFLNIGFKNFGKVWSVYLRVFLKLIPAILVLILSIVIIVLSFVKNSTLENTTFQSTSSVMFIIGMILYIIGFIYLIIKGLNYSLTSYILNENSDTSSLEIANTSEKLMQGNKWNFVKLSLSFIGWYLLIGVISAIISSFLPSNLENLSEISRCIDTLLMSALTPYITTTIYLFYEHLKDSQTVDTAQDSQKE